MILFAAQLNGSADSVKGKVHTSAISTTSRTEQLSLGLFISLVDHSVVSNGVVGNGVVGSMLSPEPKTVN